MAADMKASAAFILVLALFMVVCSLSDARGYPAAENYWRSIMKDEPMPNVIREIVGSEGSNQLEFLPSKVWKSTEGAESAKDNYFTGDFARNYKRKFIFALWGRPHQMNGGQES